MAVLCLAFALNASAQDPEWEQILELPATNCMHVASNGNLIVADFRYEWDGGIYVSKDKGQTWTKTKVMDYNYNAFTENDEYVFAAGSMGRLARSNDGGETWEVLNYGRSIADIIGEENVESTTSYGITMHNGKLFLADFCGGGVVYSEDNGETWINTDVETLSYGEEDGKLGKRPVENLYNIVSYNGDLYAFGVYFVFRYLPETNSWETISNESNFMAVSAIYKGKLCTGRSVMNDSYETPFVVTIDENGEWGSLERPANTYDNNIRAMYADGDYLFVGMQMTGFWCTPDEGAHWFTLNNKLPYATGHSFTPMNIRTDKDYLYLAAYEPPFATTTNSGVYRIAKSELPKADAIESVEQDDMKAAFDGSTLRFPAQVQSVEIYDMSGRRMPANYSNQSTTVGHLGSGAYLYRAVVGGKTVSGQFLKQ